MASPAGQALLRAIEGYRGAHAGEQGHEDIMSHLDRVHKEVVAGHVSNHGDSPGKREVGLAAGQREIASERNHDGGDGNVKSNLPGPGEFAHLSEQPGNLVSGFKGEAQTMTGAEPPLSRGNATSAKSAPPAHSGVVNFRTVAADRAREREKMTEPAKTSDGEVRSNTPGGAEPNTARVGNVAAPAKAGGDKNRAALEETPGYVGKERLGKDQWERAAAGVRKRFAEVR